MPTFRFKAWSDWHACGKPQHASGLIQSENAETARAFILSEVIDTDDSNYDCIISNTLEQIDPAKDEFYFIRSYKTKHVGKTHIQYDT